MKSKSKSLTPHRHLRLSNLCEPSCDLPGRCQRVRESGCVMRDGVSEHKPINRVSCQRTCTGRRTYSHGWRSRLCLCRRREPQKAPCYDGCLIRKARPSASRSMQLRGIALSLGFFPVMPHGHWRGGCRLLGGVHSASARGERIKRRRINDV